MSDSLAQSLVDAAAAAIAEPARPGAVHDPARVAVAAALAKLAEAVEQSAGPGLPLAMLDTYLLRDLADELREGRCP